MSGRWLRGATMTIVVLAAGGGLAYALPTSSSSSPALTINGCYGKENGQFRVVTIVGTCKNNEVPVVLGSGAAGDRGPTGLRGPTGERGATGATGAPGAAGQQGI